MSPLFQKTCVSDGKLLIAVGVYDLNTQQVNILDQLSLADFSDKINQSINY